MEFSTRKAAQKFLADKGLFLANTSPFSDQDREYWAFGQPGEGKDRLYDHSATVTRCGRTFVVSTFF